MKDQLFEIPVSESPRLKWLRQRGVTTRQTEFAPGAECPETGADLWPWYACAGGVEVGGETEQDAIVNLAKFKDWRLWNEL